MEPPLWNEGASPWPHEREALAFVQARLPNHAPYRAWNNVEFIADDGSVNEVDLIVVTTRGLYLVEIKSYPGELFGDSQRWRWRKPNGKVVRRDHPLLLSNLKAKRLRSLLSRQAALRGVQLPRVTSLVFLSSPDLDCRLRGVARTAVCGRDPDLVGPGARSPAAPATAAALPGIVETLKDPTTIGLRAHAIDRPLSAKIAQALEQAGLQPSNRGRRVGDWELGEPIDEGPGWQDFPATRPRIGAKRRARIYLAGVATTAEEQDRLRRQAEQEFRVVHDLRHDGIAQPLDLVQAERGPALLFDWHDDEERLDLWVPDKLPDLPIDARIELVRQLGEAVAHAHARKVTHRALTAKSVFVRPPRDDGGIPQLVIGHWQAGARELATELTAHGSSSDGGLGSTLIERLAASEQVYLAPEAFSAEGPDGVALDVFSLGALAFLLLSGSPPAEDLTEREAMLAEHTGLALGAAVDNPPDELAVFVSAATDPVPARRSSVRELLGLLDDTLDALTSPDAPADDADAGTDGQADEGVGVTDPLAAHRGDDLAGGWHVEARLGSGSTAVALLCRRQGSTEPVVLKVAKDEEHGERLRDEARVLQELAHPGVVKLLGVDRIGGRTALLLEPAGDPGDKLGLTLADRIDAQGRLGLDLLERFGDDLLEIVAYLEHDGIAHRDIKPDNLGVRPRRGDRSLHLVLFDFSLARTPDTSLGAGTMGYLDPFLVERPVRRWDPAAERYAVAVTLHEMATGARPQWGDGGTDPLHLTDEVPRLDTGQFDPSVRDGLAEFFARALHRRHDARYDNADEMRLAWRAVFAAAARPTTSGDGEDALDAERLDLLAEAATPDTPVGELGLSGKATSALERLGPATVEQLLDFPTADLNIAPGVGQQVRREILDAIVRVRALAVLDPGDPGDPAASIDRLAHQLVPRPTTRANGGDALRMLLGLEAAAAPALPFPQERSSAAPRPDDGLVDLAWPGAADLKARLGLDRAGYDALVERVRTRWARQPGITEVRNDLHTILERAGGVRPGDEVALALLAQRGSTATGPDRLRRARSVVRAALEAEAGRDSNRFTWRRLCGGASAVVALRSDELDGEELADFAASLGVVANTLATTDPLPSPAAVIEALRRVPAPPALQPLSDHRLVRLAAAGSGTAAVSSRMELYPRRMTAARAAGLARNALLGAGTLPADEVRSRVRSRFPAAEPLPERPALDGLLHDAVGLEWHADGPGPSGAPMAPGYRLPVPHSGAPSTAFGRSGSRYGTGTAADIPDEARAAAVSTQERLERHAEAGGYLVLTAIPSYQERAVAALSQIGATPLDVDRLVVTALRAHAEAKGIQWEAAILAADADGSDGARWSRLLAVVRDATAPVWADVVAREHVLLTHPGLLARYDLLGQLDDLRGRTRLAQPGQALRSLWVLVPAEDPDALPTIGGKPVPVTAAEHLALPEAWLLNAHGTAPHPPGDQQ